MIETRGTWYLTPRVSLPTDAVVKFYEGESNENRKYFLSRNLLNTKSTQ